MNLYKVNVTANISGYVEVEAKTEDEARELVDAMDYDEWDDVVIDSTDTPDEPELLTIICDECNEHEGDCVCEYCESCDEPIDDCECDEEEEDEDDEDES